MMIQRISMALAAAALAALTGCGGGPSLGSCSSMQGGAQACIEADGTAAGITAEQYRQQCMMQPSATYSAGGCARANVVGRCVQSLTSSTASITQTYYFYPPATVAFGMQFCTSLNGTWMSP